jgi:hypothetical protein
VIASWPCPLPQGGTAPEYALAFDRSRPHRLLILPALFDEANKIRHQIAEVMRRLDGAGIDCFLPDLPDCNESLQALNEQTLESWRKAAMAAAAHFRTTRLLTIRAAAILAPPRLSGWRYGPTSGATALRALLRARQVAAREAGLDESMEGLLQRGKVEGLELAGYRLGAALIAQLELAHLPDSGILADIEQESIGGAPPWVRAEPQFEAAQADALAAIIAMGLTA